MDCIAEHTTEYSKLLNDIRLVVSKTEKLLLTTGSSFGDSNQLNDAAVELVGKLLTEVHDEGI